MPEVHKMLIEHINQKKKYWRTRWAKMIAEPQTLDACLFRSLANLEETSLRMQAVIIKPESIAFSIDKKELLIDYVENFKRHVGLIINFLEELGFDMKTPPED